jgi:glycine/D-amino acid oxidase-like deaminating enzyme
MSTKKKTQPKVAGATVELEPNPKPKIKELGGSNYDVWNYWLANGTMSAIPAHTDEKFSQREAIASVMVDMKADDPVEGVLISQLIAASQGSLRMYRLAWAQPTECFEARIKYLALADKAARTAALLTERLDHRRGRGQQKIVVQHTTTVNADQAVVTTGGAAPVQENTGRAVSSPALLAAATQMPMPILDGVIEPELVGVGGGKKEE